MKKTNENLVILITLFAISIVIANVTGARPITTGLHIGPIELALSGGAITYAVTFLCTDIIGEIWGKATAQRVVKYGFIGQIFATACIMITGVFPATDAVMDNAYQTLLGQNWIFVIGSLSAYLVSQSWDVAVFHAIRDRYIAKHGSTKGGRWLWNNGPDLGHGDLCGHQLRLRFGLGAYPRGPDAAYRYHHRAVSSESLSGAVGYSLFLFLHKKCRPPLTASCSVRSVFRLPV